MPASPPLFALRMERLPPMRFTLPLESSPSVPAVTVIFPPVMFIEKIFEPEKRFVDMPLERIGEQRRNELKPLLDNYWNVISGISPVGGLTLTRLLHTL